MMRYMDPIVLLSLFNLLFFWSIYANPFSMATSELLSTFFPSWIHGDKNDPYYWIIPKSHPVLSTYYPPSKICSILGKKRSLDAQFTILVTLILLHYLFASIGWFVLIGSWSNPLVALFGAITLTYSSYNIKQQPCLVYTIAWFPWLLYGIALNNLPISAMSLGMVLLAGYYPIGLQIIVIALGAAIWWGSSLWFVPIGVIIGLPQLIPFLKYLPKTIRMNKHDNIGTLKLSHLLTIIFPGLNKPPCIGFWETSCYVGIVPLIIVVASCQHWHISSMAWVMSVASYLLAMGAFSRYLPRIPARWLFTFQFSLGWIAVIALSQLNADPTLLWCLIFIQAFDLWYHNRILPSKPYAELANRPSFAFNTELTRFLESHPGDYRVSGLPWPLFTGHVNRIKTLGYSGGMQLKLMAKWRNDTNPNGSGEHDYFKNNEDGEQVDTARIRYAHTTKKLDWPVAIRGLYVNPRV